MKKNTFYCLAFIVNLSLLIISDTVQAQQTKKTINKKDCFECDYFPMCTYKETKNFEGKLYREMIDDNGNVGYYYCENGVVTKKWITSYTPTEHIIDVDIFTNTEYHIYKQGDKQYSLNTMIILKSDAPVGTTWGRGSREQYDVHTIKEKDIALTVNGITYNNVIAIQADDKVLYYAKGTGLIKKVDIENYMPIGYGIIDKDIVGTWAIDDESVKDVYHYWKFNADGTGFWDFRENFSTYGPFRWRVSNNVLHQLINSSFPYRHEETKIEKLLPKISINGKTFSRLVPDDSVYSKIDVPAACPGGKEALVKAIESHLSFLKEAKEIEKGTYDVIVRFTVLKNGFLKNFTSVTHESGLEGDIIRILETYGNWLPASINGRPVNSLVEFHHVFKVP